MAALASARDDALELAATCSIAELGNLDLGSKSADVAARKRALGRTLGDMREHEAWRSGTQVGGFCMGLREELVDTASTDATIRAAANRIFEYNPEAVVNPAGTAVPETPCCARNGGLCSNRPFATVAGVVVKNIYSILKAPMSATQHTLCTSCEHCIAHDRASPRHSGG